MLTAGLLMGGGAVAVADPDSTGSSAHGDDGTNASVQGSAAASSTVGNVTDTLRKKIQRVTSTLGSGRQPGQRPSTGAKSPKKEPGDTDTEDEKKGSARVAADPNVVPPVSDVVAPVADVSAPDADVVAPVPDVVPPVAKVVPPVADVVAPVPDVVPPVADVVAPVPDVVPPVADVVPPVAEVVAVPDVVTPVADVAAPVADVVAPVADVVAPVPDVVTPVPDLVAPVADVVAPVRDLVAPASAVIAFLQDMLTAGASAVVPLTQLQSDLFSWFSSLFGIAGMQPVVVGLGGAAGGGLSAAADDSVATQLPLVRALAGIPGVPLAGNATGVATRQGIAASTFGATFGATTQVGRGSPLPGMAPLAPTGAIPTGVQPFFLDACELLLVASLWALAAAALPGVGGLGILTATGVRVGYRQAKAGFVLPAAGIARFARPGPLGVVRSGSLVVVRPRPLRVIRPGAVSAACLLDEVA